MSALDEKLRRELERVADLADPSGITDAVLRRAARRSIATRAQAVALTVAVVVGTLAGIYGLATMFGGAPERIVDGGTAVPGPAMIRGIEGEVCDVTSVEGDFLGTGESGVAYIFEPEPEGGCEGPNENFQYIGLAGPDGEVVLTSARLTEGTDAYGFRAFAAPDVDGDGIAELAVAVSDPEQSAVGFDLYRVIPPRTEQSLPSDFRIVRLGVACPAEGCVDWPAEGGLGTFAWGKSADAFLGVDCGDGSLVAWTQPKDASRTGSYILWEIGESLLTQRRDVVVDYEPHTQAPTDLCGAPVNVVAAPATDATTSPVEARSAWCAYSSLSGDVTGDGTSDVVAVHADEPAEGGCPGVGEVAYHLGVAQDSTEGDAANGDAPFDLVLRGLECGVAVGCSMFALPDIDADGTSEIAVRVDAGASAEFIALYRVRVCGPTEDCEREAWLEPIEVSEPGDPSNGVEPGPLVFGWGGSVGHMAAAYCGILEGRPPTREGGFVVWTAELGEQERPLVHAVLFSLVEGQLRLIAVNDYRAPDTAAGLPPGGGPDLCGAPIAPLGE